MDSQKSVQELTPLRAYCNLVISTYAELLAAGASNLVNILDVDQLIFAGRVVIALKNFETPVGVPHIVDFRRHLRHTLRDSILRDKLPDLEYEDVAWSDLWKAQRWRRA